MSLRSSRGRRGALAIDIIENAYALQGSDEDWLQGIAQNVLATFDEGLGVVAYIVDARRAGLELRALYREGNAPPKEAIAATLVDPPSQELITKAHLQGRLATTSEAFREAPEMIAHADRQLVEKFGVRDNLGFFASDGVNAASAFCIGLPQRRTVAAHERRFWSKLGAHVAAGLRLRARLGRSPGAAIEDRPGKKFDITLFGEAIVDERGRIVHATGQATQTTARDNLRAAVVATDKARGSLRTRDPEGAVALWRGMVDGRWTLVDHFDSDGRRFVVACENPMLNQSPRKLSQREGQVAHLVALGRSNAQVGYELGLAEGTISVQLHIALRKLGLPNRASLCAIWSALCEGEPQRFTVLDDTHRVDALRVHKQDPTWFEQLSNAEKAVAQALLDGLSNADIAQVRGTSLRTVEKQVASVLSKVGVQSRNALVASPKSVQSQSTPIANRGATHR